MKGSRNCRVIALVWLSGLLACGDGDKKPDTDEGGVSQADAGTDATAQACPEISFLAPAEGATLAEADDKDQDECANGFQYDVRVAVAAPNGSSVSLFAGAVRLAEGRVNGGNVTFEDVQLAAQADTTLAVQLADTTCVGTLPVSVACDVPSCNIVKPALTPEHPRLNGVAVESGGDRVSSAGSPYQVMVEVETTAADGTPVELSVDDSPVALSTITAGGKATFPGVTLQPDGDHVLMATCGSRTDRVGTSAKGTYPVDTEAPDLSVTRPADGTHFQDVASFSVCAASTSEDARDLPAELGETAANLCVALGSGSPSCTPLVAESAASGELGAACVDIACPGGPAFDVALTLYDRAGNRTRKIVSGLTCRTELPSVDIVAPVSTMMGDPSTRILAASASQARRDANAQQAGAQFTVVACTEVEGGRITLQAGVVDGAMNDVGTPIAAAAATVPDGCPANKPYAARFENVTLPESQENAAGQLTRATRLVATVTDIGDVEAQSPPVDVWVDSLVPTLSALAPAPLCGHFQQNASDWTTELRMNTSVLPLNVAITHADGSTQMLSAAEYSAGIVANLGSATFELGVNQVAATTTEPSGNVTALSSPCEVTVGNPPVVTWLEPTAASRLGAANDGAPAAGWQGMLRVHTDLAGVTPAATVQFSTVPGGDLGAPVTVDSNGDATLANATIPEGELVQIRATTSEVAERGIGRATISVPVDTGLPSPVSGLAVSVPPDKRRQTTFRLAWSAPDDGDRAVAGYDVRVSSAPITDLTTFDAAERVSYVGTPAQPGSPDSLEVPNRYIERDYYFAVAALDAGGNRSAIASAGPARANFNRTVLQSPAGDEQAFGRSIDGAQSLNGDAYADLVVGSGTGAAAYIYFGSATGLPASPSVTISGPSGVQFGFAAQLVGDIDGDGLTDLAVGAPVEGSGKTYVFRGRTSWPSTLNAAAAEYQISADAGNTAFAGAFLGSSFIRLNDFDGDGADDFALGGYKYNAEQGFVAVIRGVASGETFPASVTLGAGSPRTLETTGPAGTVGRIGWALTNLGAFYGGGTSVLVAAGDFYAPSGQVGRFGGAFAFGGGALDITAPLDSHVGATDTSYAGWSIAPLGALGSNMAVAVGAPAFSEAGANALEIHRGSTATGPFIADPIVLTNSAAVGAGDAFGCVFGSVIPGVAASVLDHRSSFVGTTLPDVAVSSSHETGGVARLYLIDGEKVATTLSSGDVASVADVIVPLPEEWTGYRGCMPRSGAIRDLNDDGYADLAIGQYLRVGTFTGQVLVLW